MNSSDIVKEQQAYERKRNEIVRCGLSWVQATNAIVLNGAPHAGTVAHRCDRPIHPGGEPCQCKCGVKALVKK